ncbi:MAG: HAD-IC family P-type ATPase, partial [Pseudomonadota bacterium]
MPKAPGDLVIGGSLNGTGSLDVRVTALAGDSVLAKIAAQVEAAQASKLPVQHMVDRITAWFVPAVLALAAVTCLAWLVFGPGLSQAMVAAISVLIIACPCAMGLAVPVSILVGTGRGAEQGVLIRDGAALQRLAGVDVVAFDKTGTLTEGRPEVEQVIAAASSSEDEVLRLAAQVARGSEHVLAKAIAAHSGPGAVADQFVAHPGLGAEGMVEGDEVRIGQAGFVAPGAMAAPAQAAAETGAGLVYVSKAGTCIGVITLRDRLRPASARTIKGLVEEGREVVVLSGDTQSASEAIL